MVNNGLGGSGLLVSRMYFLSFHTRPTRGLKRVLSCTVSGIFVSIGSMILTSWFPKEDAGDIKDLLMKKETRTPRKHDSIFSESDTKASMIEEIEIKEQEDHKTPAEKDTQGMPCLCNVCFSTSDTHPNRGK